MSQETPNKNLKRILADRAKAAVRFISFHIFSRLWKIVPRSLFFNDIPNVGVALTRICNANCTFCTYQLLDKDGRKAMSTDVFEKVLEEIKKNPGINIQLSPNLGEPGLAPRLMEKIKAMRQAGANKIEITTNATTLHKIGIDRFLNEGPDVINISTSGFNKEMYERVYRHSGYENMKNNLVELLTTNAQREKRKVINIWLRGDIEFEEHDKFPEMQIAKEYATEIGTMTGVDSWNGEISQDMLTGNMQIETDVPEITRRPCGQLTSIAVHPDGGMHACACRNIYEAKDMYLGNIEETGLRAANQNVGKIFDRWERGIIPKLCKSCCMYDDAANQVLGTFVKRATRKIVGKNIHR